MSTHIIDEFVCTVLERYNRKQRARRRVLNAILEIVEPDPGGMVRRGQFHTAVAKKLGCHVSTTFIERFEDAMRLVPGAQRVIHHGTRYYSGFRLREGIKLPPHKLQGLKRKQ